MLNSTSFVFVVKQIGQEPTSLIIVSNYWAISWLIRQILVEKPRQDWLGQEQTSVITVSNYWAISLLARHSLVENTRQNWLGQESTSVSNYLSISGRALCLITLGHISAYNMDNTILLLLWSTSETAFPLKPLGQMIWNLIRSIYGRSSIEIAHFVLIH